MFNLSEVKIETSCADETAMLIFRDEHLIAILVRLDDAVHGQECGRWHFEAAFDQLSPRHETFASIEDAEQWIDEQMFRRASQRAERQRSRSQ